VQISRQSETKFFQSLTKRSWAEFEPCFLIHLQNKTRDRLLDNKTS
jgi:hypothetical protein